MTRVVVVVAALCLIAFLVYRQGGKDALQTHRENTLETSKDISDAINDADNSPSWRDVLLGRD